MRSATLDTHLQHSPEAAFDFLSDLRNDPVWRPEVDSSELIEGQPRSPGARYRERVTWEGIHADATLSVVAAVSAESLTIVAQDPGYVSTYEYSFVPNGSGTDLQLRMSLETEGPLRLIEPFMWSLVHRWVQHSFEQLDAALSSRESPSE